MHKSLLIIFFAVCYRFISFGQIEGANIILTTGDAWLSFDCKGVHFIDKSNQSSYDLSSSISDTFGNILFSVRDSVIYDKNDARITNLDSFSYSSILDFDLIVPNPQNIAEYYIFYGWYGSKLLNHYCTYNVIAKKITSKGLLSSGESYIASAKVPGKQAYWLFFSSGNDISAYLIDNAGLHSNPVTSKKFPSIYPELVRMNNECSQLLYSLPMSPGDSVQMIILDFDKSLGTFYMDTSFIIHNSGLTGGCFRGYIAISPDSKKLYFPTGCGCGACKTFSIVQYDLSKRNADTIINSAITVYYGDKNRRDWTEWINGPDCKLYNSDYNYNFGIINNPDFKGIASGYTIMNTKTFSSYQPANFLTRQDYWPSFSIDTATNNSLELIFTYNAPKAGETYLWDFGDPSSGSLNHDTGKTASHVFVPSNVYYVRLLVFNNGYHTTFTRLVCVHQGIITPVKDTVLCILDSLKLDAGNPGSKFLWSNGDTSETTIIEKTGKYWIRIVNDHAILSDTFTVGLKNIYLNLGKDVSVCKGNDYMFSSNIKDANYLWSTGDTSSYILAKQPGVYWLKVDSVGCIGYDSVNLAIINLPKVNIGPDTAICSGTVLKLRSNISNASYLWSTGDTTVSILIENPSVYWLRVDSVGCYGYDTILVTVNPLPDIVPHPVTYFCVYDSASIQLTENASYSYKWETGDTTASIRVSEPGIYNLILKTDKGCVITDSFIVKSNCPGKWFMPDVFSPNGDGHNDSFKAIGIDITAFNMSVYNRWGECVFTSTDVNKGWDGTFKGLKAPEDIYLYMANCQFPGQPKQFAKGTVLLVR